MEEKIDMTDLLHTIIHEDRTTAYELVKRTGVSSRTIYLINRGEQRDTMVNTMLQILFETGRDLKWLTHYYETYKKRMQSSK